MDETLCRPLSVTPVLMTGTLWKVLAGAWRLGWSIAPVRRGFSLGCPTGKARHRFLSGEERMDGDHSDISLVVGLRDHGWISGKSSSGFVRREVLDLAF
jgi:hypothetical protein